MKNALKFMATLLITTTAVGCFTGCTPEAETYTYVSLKVNPEIELIVDDNGEVVSVNAVNEDGEVVISEGEFEGKTVEEACEEFTEISTELGYIDVDINDNTVYLHVDGKDEETVEEIVTKVTKRMHDFFDKKGIYGRVSNEELKEFETLAREWNVSVKDAKLINRILELYPEMSVEEIIALSIEEKIDLIKKDKVNNGITCDLREEYRIAVEALKEEYSLIKTLSDEMLELERSLTAEDLSEDEIASINEKIESKKAELNNLKEELKTKLEALKEAYKSNAIDSKEEFKRQANERKDEFRNKLEEHLNHFEKHKDSIMENIRDWRK